MMIIKEGSYDEDTSDYKDDSHRYNIKYDNESSSGDNFEPSDYLQAFSNFSYRFTN